MKLINSVKKVKQRMKKLIDLRHILLIVSFWGVLFSCTPSNVTEQVSATPTLSVGVQAKTVNPTPTFTVKPDPTSTFFPTLTATPSFTSAPTAEPTNTPVPSFTVVSTPVATSTWVALFFQENEIWLIGPLGEMVKKISIRYLHDVQWSSDGCHLLISTLGPQGMALHGIDLSNDVQYKILAESDMVDENPDFLRLSPDGKWITYVVQSGKDQDRGVKLRDVKVIAAEAPDKPVSLTKRGGAGVLGGVWSPDGQRVAYSDYDEAGNGQVYLSRPDGSDRHQLTHFTAPKTTMNWITWSPDGQELAFAIYDNQEDNQYEVGNRLAIWVVHSDGSGPREMILNDGRSVQGTPLWWEEDNRTLVVSILDDIPGEGLYWFDVNTGHVVHVFYDATAPSGSIFGPFPLADVQMIMFMGGDRNFYSYDPAGGIYKLWIDMSPIFPTGSGSMGMLLDVVPVPGGIVDISQCPSK